MNTRRLAAIAILLAAAVPGTWWRSPVPHEPMIDGSLVALRLPQVAGDGAATDLVATGLWRIAGSGAGFGGFSALLPLPQGRLRAFSDRGWRLTFDMPGSASRTSAAKMIAAPGYRQTLYDIEAATRDPRDGSYWLAYESIHAIHRFDRASEAGPLRVLTGEVRWPANSGIEAMARLADGSFMILPETGDTGYISAGDPTEGAAMESFPIAWPVGGFDPTDAAGLPDGRLLVLMRRLRVAVPQDFDSLLLVGAMPVAGEPWRPQLLARLDEMLPRENYEGLAVRPLADGGSEIWIISDDNFSAFQQTLLARLEYRPNERAREAEPRAPLNSSD